MLSVSVLESKIVSSGSSILGGEFIVGNSVSLS
jgi:hypothetical protein